MLRLAILVLINVAFVRPFEDMTVYQYLQVHNPAFAQLIRETGQNGPLNGPGPYTVLAPTDAALNSIDPDLAVLLAHNDLQKRQLIKYHLLKGYTLTPQLHQGDHLTSVEGQRILVERNQLNNVVLNTDSLILSGSDIICKNGVIQTIDHILMPPVFGHNNIMEELVVRDRIFNEFTVAVLLTNLTELMKNSEVTVFAPTDTAWGKHYQSILHPSIHIPNRQEMYYEMLKYHIVPGSRTSSMLHDGDQLYTLHGTPINITVDQQGEMHVNKYARVSDPDMPATNGMIHAIDDLLFPRDLIQQFIQAYCDHHQTNAGCINVNH